MPEPTVTITVRLDPQIYKALVKIARDSRITFQRVTEDACRQFIKRSNEAA